MPKNTRKQRERRNAVGKNGNKMSHEERSLKRAQRQDVDASPSSGGGRMTWSTKSGESTVIHSSRRFGGYGLAGNKGMKPRFI